MRRKIPRLSAEVTRFVSRIKALEFGILGTPESPGFPDAKCLSVPRVGRLRLMRLKPVADEVDVQTTCGLAQPYEHRFQRTRPDSLASRLSGFCCRSSFNVVQPTEIFHHLDT